MGFRFCESWLFQKELGSSLFVVDVGAKVRPNVCLVFVREFGVDGFGTSFRGDIKSEEFVVPEKGFVCA